MKLTREQYLFIGTALAILLVIFMGLAAYRAGARDDRRVADLEGLARDLNVYYLQYHRYPAKLSDLIDAGAGVHLVLDDPSAPDRHYLYAIPEDGQHYVLSVTLEDGSNSKLQEDVDGDVYGLDCNDRPSYNYCLRSS